MNKLLLDLTDTENMTSRGRASQRRDADGFRHHLKVMWDDVLEF